MTLPTSQNRNAGSSPRPAGAEEPALPGLRRSAPPGGSEGRAVLSARADESWVPERQRPLVRNASAFRAELGNRSSVPSVCVFGYGFKTITDVTMTREPLGGSRVEEFIFTDRGDGMIPEASAVMPGAKIHPVRQRHSALFMDADVKMRLKLELTG